MVQLFLVFFFDSIHLHQFYCTKIQWIFSMWTNATMHRTCLRILLSCQNETHRTPIESSTHNGSYKCQQWRISKQSQNRSFKMDKQPFMGELRRNIWIYSGSIRIWSKAHQINAARRFSHSETRIWETSFELKWIENVLGPILAMITVDQWFKNQNEYIEDTHSGLSTNHRSSRRENHDEILHLPNAKLLRQEIMLRRTVVDNNIWRSTSSVITQTILNVDNYFLAGLVEPISEIFKSISPNEQAFHNVDFDQLLGFIYFDSRSRSNTICARTIPTQTYWVFNFFNFCVGIPIRMRSTFTQLRVLDWSFPRKVLQSDRNVFA